MSKVKDNIKVANLWIDLVYGMLKYRLKLTEDFNNNYMICKKICQHVIKTSDITLTVNGKENIPEEGSVLIASNHRSFFDIIILLASIDRAMSFVVAKELCEYPILRKYIESINCVPVNREETDITKMKEQLRNMSDALKEKGLILFPEGKCNYFEDEIAEFKKGGFKGVKTNDSTIVPTYINMGKIKNIGRWVIPTEEVTVTFGEPYKMISATGEIIKPNEIANYTREKVLELKRNSTNRII